MARPTLRAELRPAALLLAGPPPPLTEATAPTGRRAIIAGRPTGIIPRRAVIVLLRAGTTPRRDRPQRLALTQRRATIRRRTLLVGAVARTPAEVEASMVVAVVVRTAVITKFN